MLTKLQVKNYILIDSLDIDFPAGLVIITGQTGAGKSILLGALSLALGGKAAADVIGESGDNCVVEADFDVTGDEAIREIMEDAGLDAGSVNLTIRRVLGKSGRSRSFVNDEPVSVKVLNALSSRLVDIHSQHHTMILTDKKFQLSILDHYAGNADLLEQCAVIWRRISGLEGEIGDLEDRIRSLQADKEYNESRFRQLEEANLQDGELEELEAEQKQLANAEEIKGSLCTAIDALSPQDDSERQSVDALLREAARQLMSVSSYLPAAEALVRRMESSRIEIEDILGEVETLEEQATVSPERLEQVEARMSLLYDLFKKFGCRDVAGLISKKDELSGLIYDSDALVQKVEGLKKELDSAKAEAAKVSAELHEKRTAAAEPFAKAIENGVHGLEMETSVFKVELSEIGFGKTGTDAVQFCFSSTGGKTEDVAKCASGGEMSRIMLCLKAMMARYTKMPSMVFDEIDTGVSGSTADKMGSMICSMGQDMQVFAITHLPQVAAKGDAHFLVSKNVVDGKTVTNITRITGEERTAEIARMLSGSKITDAAIQNAKALLGSAS